MLNTSNVKAYHKIDPALPSDIPLGLFVCCCF